MSTFGGLMAEYPQIAIDRFQGPAVLRARAYFLSHAHADHMVGLESQMFSRRLRSSNHVKLYCSEVTYEFLLTDRRFIHLEHFLISLPIEEPTTITLCDDTTGKDEQVLVTLLAAGHCPGSVMFLFEGDEGNVLYTGDFRFAKGEVARMDPLHSGARVKDIKSAYVDTTFCVPEAMYIPSREQSKDALLDLVEQQIQKSPTHMVRLACKAKYGYEYLFVEISKEFNLKVHVSAMVMAQYERVPDLAKHLTTEGSSTQVHACRYVDCSMHNATDVLVVVPSTMWFTSNAQPSDILRKVGHRYRLCFSFHSSFSEVRDFLSYIRPVNIYPNVIPYRCTEKKIKERLEDLRRGAIECGLQESASYKPLGQLKVSARKGRTGNTACRTDDDDEDEFAELFGDSPPPGQRRKKMKISGGEEHVRSQSDGDQHIRISLDKDGSNDHSYIAMDDSDLSSCELDLYDSAPGYGQSETHKDGEELTVKIASVSGDFDKSTGLDDAPKTTQGSHSLDISPRMQTEDSEIVKREKEPGSEKLSKLKSKHAKINSWLRYLPKSDVTTNQPHYKQEDDSVEKLSCGSTDEPKANARTLIDKHHKEFIHDDSCKLKISLKESNKMGEHRFRRSQDSSPKDKLQDISEYFLTNSQKSESSRGCLDHNDENQSEEQNRTEAAFEPRPTSSKTVKDKASTRHTSLSWIDPSDKTSLLPGQHVSPLKTPNQAQSNFPQMESNMTAAALSSQQVASVSESLVSYQGTSEGQSTINDDHNEQSQDTCQSEETFLPSSQGSFVSRCSSDFDIASTPEAKKPHPAQVEAVQAMIARGEPIPLASCNKTIQLD